jgi:hypothetical protein
MVGINKPGEIAFSCALVNQLNSSVHGPQSSQVCNIFADEMTPKTSKQNNNLHKM